MALCQALRVVASRLTPRFVKALESLGCTLSPKAAGVHEGRLGVFPLRVIETGITPKGRATVDALDMNHEGIVAGSFTRPGRTHPPNPGKLRYSARIDG